MQLRERESTSWARACSSNSGSSSSSGSNRLSQLLSQSVSKPSQACALPKSSYFANCELPCLLLLLTWLCLYVSRYVHTKYIFIVMLQPILLRTKKKKYREILRLASLRLIGACSNSLKGFQVTAWSTWISLTVSRKQKYPCMGSGALFQAERVYERCLPAS